MQDKTNRELIHVYAVIPRFSKTSSRKNKIAAEIIDKLRAINNKLNKQIGFCWKDEWFDGMPIKLKKASSKDWFIGRSSIPLMAIKQLAQFDCQKELNEIYEIAEYFCSTTGKVFCIPKQLDEDLAYLVGAILGDGHLRLKNLEIYFSQKEEKDVKKFQEKYNRVFCTDATCKKRTPKNKGTEFYLKQSCKPIVRFLERFFEIPRGKKSHIIKVPEVIKNSEKRIKLAFLEGVFDTDGCIRKKGFRLTTASLEFRNDLCVLLKSLGEKGYVDEWINKKYHKKYYGLQYSVRNIDFIAGIG